MLIPYNTDAPIYHFPFVTIGLIVINLLVHGLTFQDQEQVLEYMLFIGDGLHPVQWVTNTFLHGDWMHVIGNMFFLWGFGLVVEGKLGWWKFLLVYLAIGIIDSAIIQTVMLNAEFGVSIGASDILFGLLAISLVWAPKNDMSCILWLGVFSRLVEVPITVFATVYFILQITLAALDGFSLSGEMLHLLGAAVGSVFGIALLKLDLVDCEGWDLFNVWAGRTGVRPELYEERKSTAPANSKSTPALAHGKSPSPAQPNSKTHAPLLSPEQSQRVVRKIAHCLSLDDSAAAVSHYEAHRRAHPEWALDEKELLTLIRALHKQNHWSESVKPMADYIRQFPKASIRMQMRLAQILLEVERRPAKALKVLAKIDGKKLTADLLPTYKKLILKAKALREQGELEIADAEDEL